MHTCRRACALGALVCTSCATPPVCATCVCHHDHHVDVEGGDGTVEVDDAEKKKIGYGHGGVECIGR